MNIKFSIGQGGGTITIQREEQDPRAKASGFTRHTHGWGPEIHLMFTLSKKLNSLGFNLFRRKMGRDGHLMGDDHTPYLRVRDDKTSAPQIYIYDGMYALRNSAEEYNARKSVLLNIEMDVFGKQADCYERVAQLCSLHGIECHVTNPK